MVQLYADLVELGLRALKENDKGIILVPNFLQENVNKEIEKRNMKDK